MVFRSAAIPFDFHLSFAFELVDKPIHLLAIKVGDLVLSRSFGPRADPWRVKAETPKVKIRPQFSRLDGY